MRDARAAAAYYRDVLGFDQVALLGGNPPSFAIVRRNGAMLLLQDVAGSPDQTPAAGPPWDALLLVDDVQAVHSALRGRGVASLGKIDGKGIGWDSFDFSDPYGNVICVGRSTAAFFAAHAPRESPVSRLRGAWRKRRSRREERALLDEFQRFYDRLPDKRNVFYMFFTSNLLHWVGHAESFVPREVNLVLLGAGLTPDERRWLAERVNRPVHHIALPVDDVTAWEFLFATNRHDFGWLDIDCFVLNEKLFDEMTNISPETSINCTWTWDSGQDFRVAATHFLFVNAEVIRAMASHGVAASPSTYDWTGGPRKFPPRRCFMKVPTERERELMLTVLPAGEDGRPRFIEGSYYNTLVVYQVLAQAIGHRVHQVRRLARRCAMPTDAESTDPRHWPEDMSDELFHLYGVSYYKTHHQEPGIRALYLAAEYAMLDSTGTTLPPQYEKYRETIAAELVASGVEPTTARERFRRHLIEGRGLNEATADRVLRLVLQGQNRT